MVDHKNQVHRDGSDVKTASDGTKAWTVMVFMAADTTLTNFAVESLKQMKASQSDYVNVVAEFDCGRALSSERYFFGELAADDPDPDWVKERKRDRLASISYNIVSRLEAQDVGDPETLTNFIEWSVKKYPAHQYFLILWGHGAGIDDESPFAQNGAKQDALEQDRNNRFLISRHHPLPTDQNALAQSTLKSIGFVDRPISYLTNEGLKKALKDAQNRINENWTLNFLGMDACNMNLVELGYEVRKFADYLIASQDEIPDASWPYYNLLHNLARETRELNRKYIENQAKAPSEAKAADNYRRSTKINEKYTPNDIYCTLRSIARTYTEAYQDYIDQPVALSALDLEILREGEEQTRGDNLRSLFTPLVDMLQLHSTHREVNDAVIFARKRVRSFYTRIPNTREFHTRDIYIDLVHFCKLLSSFLKEFDKEPKVRRFIEAVDLFFSSRTKRNDNGGSNSKSNDSTIAIDEKREASGESQPKHQCGHDGNLKDLTALIAVNERSRGEEDCYGTSIYFPATPEDEFGSFYEELEFAQDTLWAAFINEFLERNPNLLIPPKFEMKAARVKGNPRDDDPRNLQNHVKGDQNIFVKGNPRIPEKGNPRLLDKLAQVMVPGANPVIANHSSQDDINPSIYNVIYNYGTIIEVGDDENSEGQ